MTCQIVMFSATVGPYGSSIGQGMAMEWCQTHNCLAFNSKCLHQMALDIKQLNRAVAKLQEATDG